MSEREYFQSIRGLSRNTDPSEVPEEILDFAAEYNRQPQVIPELVAYEVAQTAPEERALEAFNDAFVQLLDGTEIEPFGIDLDCVHTIPARVFNQYCQENGAAFNGQMSSGFVQDGHFYVPDNLTYEGFLVVFSHEFIHGISHLKKLVRIFENKNTGDEPQFAQAYAVLRSGLHQEAENLSGGPPKIYGSGLNEGVTELLASKLRALTSYPREQKVDRRVYTKLEGGPTTYHGQIIVIQELCKKYFADNLELGSPRLQELLRLFILADPTLLQNLNQALRADGKNNGLKILFQMGVSPQDALACAEQLGLEDAVKQLKK